MCLCARFSLDPLGHSAPQALQSEATTYSGKVTEAAFSKIAAPKAALLEVKDGVLSRSGF